MAVRRLGNAIVHLTQDKRRVELDRNLEMKKDTCLCK